MYDYIKWKCSLKSSWQFKYDKYRPKIQPVFLWFHPVWVDSYKAFFCELFYAQIASRYSVKLFIYKRFEMQYQLTLWFAVIFTLLQAWEFKTINLMLTDGIYGSVFFFLTGLHGLHVLIGTIFLTICYFKIIYFSIFHLKYRLNLYWKSWPVGYRTYRGINRGLFLFTFIRTTSLFINNNIFVFFPRVGLKCAIWYWHFVDVVWIFLFVYLYLYSN